MVRAAIFTMNSLWVVKFMADGREGIIYVGFERSEKPGGKNQVDKPEKA